MICVIRLACPSSAELTTLSFAWCFLDFARNPSNCPEQERIGPLLITPEAPLCSFEELALM